MIQGNAAYYTYLAEKEMTTVRLFRKFGYLASADHAEAKARRYERLAAECENAPPVLPDEAPHFHQFPEIQNFKNGPPID